MSRTDLRQLWTMTASDLRQRIRDRSVIIFALVVPLALMFVFNLALSGMEDVTLDTIDVAVAMPDGDQLAATLVDAALNSDAVEVNQTTAPADEVRELVRSGEVAMGIVVPEDFSEAVTSGRETVVDVVEGDQAGLESSVVVAVLQAVLDRFAAGTVAAAAGAQLGLPPEQLAVLAEEAATAGPQITLTEGETSNEQLSSSATRLAELLSCSLEVSPSVRVICGPAVAASSASTASCSGGRPSCAPAAAATVPAANRSRTACRTATTTELSSPAWSPSTTSTTVSRPLVTASLKASGTTMPIATSPDRTSSRTSSAGAVVWLTSTASEFRAASTSVAASWSPSGMATATSIVSRVTSSMPLRARLKTNIRARGTTRAKMITDLSRIRWRRSDAVMVHSWRRSVRLMSVPQGLAGELEEDRLQVRPRDLEVGERHPRSAGRRHDGRDGRRGVADGEDERVPVGVDLLHRRQGTDRLGRSRDGAGTGQADVVDLT